MKKVMVMMLSAMMIFIMSGCKTNSSVSDAVITPTDPTSTSSPTKAEEKAEEDEVQLQPGFEAWEASDAVKALNKVLMMEETVTVVPSQEVSTGAADLKQYYLNKINHIQDYEFEQDMTPDQYAIADMDHDGTPEVLVRLSIHEDQWVMVLRFYKGTVYGYSYGLRGFESPKTDGTYLASSGALDNNIMELGFDGIKAKENCLGYSTLNNDIMEYYIADHKVSEKEYNAFSEKYYNSEDVKWYLFPSNLRAGYIGEELFHVDFEAITQPTGKELERYYSAMESDVTFTHSSRIPGELCEIIVEAMKTGKEEEDLGSLKEGTDISQEEFCRLTGVHLEEMEQDIPVRVDADNDGYEDLIALHYWGGTGGFSSMELYRGSETGEFILTSSLECSYQDYKVISYQGRNYLLMKDFDYNTKYASGYTLYLYQDGILADGMSFRFDIEDYEMKIAYESSSFGGIEQMKDTLCNKDLPDVLNNNNGVIDGTGEIIDNSNTDYRYSCDIDNDGSPEYYNKSMWYPSNMGTVMECSYNFKDSKILDDLCDRLEEEMGEGRLYTFWIDKVDDKNIMYLYYGNNLDFTLFAYLLERAE